MKPTEIGSICLAELKGGLMDRARRTCARGRPFPGVTRQSPVATPVRALLGLDDEICPNARRIALDVVAIYGLATMLVSRGLGEV